ncbi:DUF1840 domain-containing protein [Pelomonas sp. SE-A7]|uniref:DUF1840 domain-containing protein n=1 Tax=Pelomonas sp. SE-A7 TaxID=3054953 RepID=UPI00259CD515|nr:DUF1840 domain-containing protein [Pelomonas sp. SE-A7]MDM4768000.1 DUF1840 domain-containing protein [Pelomonas sp. SE-A7]
MIYRFKSKAGADVIMLGPNGEQVIRILGREPAPQGLLALDQLGAISDSLQQAVADDEARFAKLQAEAEANGEPPPKREGVQLRQRVWPLVELIRHSLREKTDIIWSVQ